jgi:hypothetical protein
MANTVKITVDGMEREITLPNYALESTQEKVLKALTLQGARDKGNIKALEDLVTGANKKAKDDKKAQTEADVDRNNQLDALKSINKNIKETGGTGSNLNKFGTAVKFTAKEVFNFGATVLGGVSTAITSLFVQANSLGTEFGKLQMTGTGLDTAGMSALNLSTSLNALGFTTDQALSVMAEYAGVVQTVGRQAFIDVNKQFLQLTGSGTKLGLTLNQAADVLAEDLELRKMLGMIQDISTNKQAKLSAQLFAQQLQATTILGKSIDDIRGAAKAALDGNETVQLSILAATAGMDSDAAANFTNGLQKAAGDMAAVGVDQNIINSVIESALAPVAFMGEGGASLNKALTALDAAAGSSLRAQVQAANAAKQRGDMDEFNRIMNNFDDEMMKAASNLDENDLKQLLIQLPALGGASKDLALSLGQLRLASKNAANAQNASISALTKSATAFDNAQNQISSSFNMAMNNVSGALGAPMEALALAFSDEVVMRNKLGELVNKQGDALVYSAEQIKEMGLTGVEAGDAIKDMSHLTKEQQDKLQKTNGIFGTFRNAMDKINEAFRKLFNPIEDGSNSIGNLANIIANKVNPYIEKFGEYVAEFIGSITAEDIEATIDGVVLALTGLWEGLKLVGSVVKSVVGMFVDVDEQQVAVKDKDGNPVLDEAGDVLMKSVKKIDIGGTIINGLIGLFAANLVRKGFSTALNVGMSGLMKKAGGMFGGKADDAVGGAAKSVGGGLGKGVGGFFKGIAAGLKTLGNPAAIKGAATLLLVGGAIVVAGKGFQQFSELDWGTIGKGLAGMAGLGAIAGVIGLFAPAALAGAAALGAVGLALQLFPSDTLESLGIMMQSVFAGIGEMIGGVMEGVGTGIAKASDAIANFKTAGAEAESIKLDAQASAMERLSAIPTANIVATAEAVSMLAGSMSAFGDAVGDDGFMGIGADGADVDKQNEQIGVFAKFAGLDSVAIISTSDALSQMATTYAKFANLDADKLMAVSTAMEEINKASAPDVLDNAKQFVNDTLGSVASKLGFGSNDVANPTPDTQAVARPVTDGNTSAGTQMLPDGITKDTIALINKLNEVKLAVAGATNKQTKEMKKG